MSLSRKWICLRIVIAIPCIMSGHASSGGADVAISHALLSGGSFTSTSTINSLSNRSI